MKRVLRFVLYAVIFLFIFAAGAITYISYALPNVGPAPKIEVEVTEERVERGKYLAWHVMQCMECHAKRDFTRFGAPPIPETIGAGGERFDHALGLPGVFISPNITPHGIGEWTDGELFRLLTSGVKKDGNPIFPIMPYPNYGKMDEEDIKSVIAYLRTLDPIVTNHGPSKADFPLNLIMRTFPEKPNLGPRPPMTDTVAYGFYMLNASACGDCHTKFEGGAYTGEFLAGGREFKLHDGSILRSTNITPHETGLKNWDREMFIQRFKGYQDSLYSPPSLAPGEFQTIMPWLMYADMKEDDLAAIFAYLKSVEPVQNEVERFTSALE